MTNPISLCRVNFMTKTIIMASLCALTSAFCATSFAAVVSTMDLLVNHIAYDRASQRILATIARTGGEGMAGTLAIIDPSARKIVRSVPLGTDAGVVALSADGEFAYVSVDGGTNIARYHLPSDTVDLRFVVGDGYSRVADIAVSPLDSGVIALSLARADSPSFMGVRIYDDGSLLSAKVTGHTGPNQIAFSDGKALYGIGTDTSSFTFYVMSVDGNGVAIDAQANGLVRHYRGDIEFAGGIVYGSTGVALDPTLLRTLGTYQSSGALEVDPVAGLVYFQPGASSLKVYDLETFVPLRTLNISGAEGLAVDLIRWGVSGLASTTSRNQLFLIEPDASKPATATVPLPNSAALLLPLLPLLRRRGRAGSRHAFASTRPSRDPSSHRFLLSIPLLVLGSSAQAVTTSLLRLPTNDLVFDPVSQRLLASVPSSAGPGLGNTITVIDPVQGTIEASVFIGSEPHELSLARGMSTLWVRIDGAYAFRRFDTLTRTIGPLFPVGHNPGEAPMKADSIAALPGRSNALVISRGIVGSTGRRGTALYVDGIERGPNLATEAQTLAITDDAQTLVGFAGFTTAQELWRGVIDQNGARTLAVMQSYLVGTALEMTNDVVYTTFGYALDPRSLAVLGRYTGGGGAVEVVQEENRVYFMYETELKIFNLTTFDLLDTVQLPNVSGRIDQLVRTGPERLAINTDAGNVYMIDLKPPLPTTPIPAMPRTSELALAIMLIGMRLRLRARERHSGDKQQRTLHR